MKVGGSFNPWMMFMSCTIPNVIAQCQFLTSTAKLCYGRLLQFSGRNGRCFPSIDALAKEIGVGERQIQRVLSDLEQKGFIKRVPRVRENNSQTSNMIEFLWHEIYEKGSLEDATDDTPPRVTGDTPPDVTDGTPLNRISLLNESVRSKEPKGSLVCNPSGCSVNKPLLLKRRVDVDLEQTDIPLNGRLDVRQIISYWNSSPGLKHHGVPGNGHKKTDFIKQTISMIGAIIDGKFFPKEWPPYSVEQIIKAIDSFKSRATDPNYFPTDKTKIKHLSLSNFFWNPFATKRKSVFQECLENPPKLISNIVKKEEEKNPAMTKWLQNIYTEKILLGQPRKFNQVEINKFIKGANQLFDSMEPLSERANLLTGPREFCEYAIDALIKQFGENGVSPGSVASEWTYTELLPRYLTEIGRID